MTWRDEAVPPPLGPKTIHVWRAGVEADESRIAAQLGVLSAAERDRAARFSFDEPRHRFIRARAVLRRLLGAYLDTDPQAIELDTGDLGKPHLVHPPESLHFNLSHSGGVILLAFARDRDVGVDVERRQRSVDWNAVAARFFTTEEQRDLRALPERERRAAFFRCWTRKEAFLKATGQGVTFGLENVQVSLRPEEAAAVRWLARGEAADWRLADADPDAEHAGAVCAPGTWELQRLAFSG